jgi:hypothetical protein
MPPPTSTPPTSSVPNINNVIDDFLDRLQDRLDQSSNTFEEFRQIVDDILADFRS